MVTKTQILVCFNFQPHMISFTWSKPKKQDHLNACQFVLETFNYHACKITSWLLFNMVQNLRYRTYNGLGWTNTGPVCTGVQTHGMLECAAAPWSGEEEAEEEEEERRRREGKEVGRQAAAGGLWQAATVPHILDMCWTDSLRAPQLFYIVK